MAEILHNLISEQINKGTIKSLEDLYKLIPKRQVARIIGKEPVYFTNKKAASPEKFTVLEIKAIAAHFNVVPEKVFSIIANSF